LPASQSVRSAGYAHIRDNYRIPDSGPGSDLAKRLANAGAYGKSLTTYRLPGNIEVGGGINVAPSRFVINPEHCRGVAFQGGTGLLDAQAMAKFPVTENIAFQFNFIISATINFSTFHPAHVVPGAGRTAISP
jgi:hypothetical protein